ncbi:MAG TPA: cytochrome P450 [Steroidobacteraceae bacterium]|jgi:cytochrome P450|nr:cytochrome P450 [Steroidobacteraceae bacterium]
MPDEYDPTTEETFEGTYAQFADLRARCPVAHSSAFEGFWAVTRYQDVLDILLQPDLYITSVRNVVPGSSATGRRPPLHLDPPEHTPYRKAIDRALGAARVAAIEPTTRRVARELMESLVARGEADFVEHFSSPLPAAVFGEWLGLTDAQTQVLWRTARAYVKAWESFDRSSVAVAAAQLAEMAAEVIAERRREPRDPEVDPTSSLLASRDDAGQPFPEVLLAGCVRQVLVVGLVAPPILLGSIAVHLARDVPLQRQLRADPSLLSDAVEEFLRLYTPYRGFARSAREEVELHGRLIRPGEPIALVYASANRDESVFPDADQFRLRRPNIRQHLAFGRGPHMCAGIALARQELRIALDELLRQTRHFEICGELRMSGMPEVGPISVPLRLQPAAG